MLNGRTLFMMVMVMALAMIAQARAAQDDGDADIQPTPEERAKAVVMKRWPDAAEVEALDVAGETDEAEVEGEEEGEEADVPDGEEVSDWTVSVTFVSGGIDFEVLVSDAGAIRYIYEELPADKTPKKIIDAARAALKDGEIIYIDRMTDEHKTPAVVTYTIGIGEKDVTLDADGKVVRIDDAMEEEEAPGAEGGEQGEEQPEMQDDKMYL
jgi:hypothetical protein